MLGRLVQGRPRVVRLLLVAPPGEAVVLEALQIGRRQLLEDRSRARPLQGQGRRRRGHVLDLHVEARGVEVQPAEVRVGGGEAERLLAEARDGAVVDHLAGRVAPGGIEHLAHLGPGDVARDDAVKEPLGIRAHDQVLVERRHVEQRRRAADSVVLAVVGELVRAGDHVPRPPAPRLALAQRGGARVERRLPQHRSLTPGTPARLRSAAPPPALAGPGPGRATPAAARLAPPR